MIHIIITSFNEPKATIRAVKSFLKQEINDDFKIIVVDPFPEIREFLKKEINDKRIEFFSDPGEGKSYALNLLFQEIYSENKNDIIILSDGDVYVSENAVSEIFEAFKKQEVGCVTGKPVSVDSRNTKYGYWSHLLFDGINNVRKKHHQRKKFFECSGYLFAIRNGVIMDFPLGACEDAVTSYLFWKKGYKIFYADNAEVYVKNPDNWKDWKNQKIRNIKGHENLNQLFPDMPRTKSFFNEIKEGLFFSLMHPRNVLEFYWLLHLYFARLYIYLKAFQEIKQKKSYKDGWREIETPSTKPLD
ncbi:MAG: glycosyltransferase family 2 protein [Nanoarchaeota archaeon]